jgi:hypothetical protein
MWLLLGHAAGQDGVAKETYEKKLGWQGATKFKKFEVVKT